MALDQNPLTSLPLSQTILFLIISEDLHDYLQGMQGHSNVFLSSELHFLIFLAYFCLLLEWRNKCKYY